MRDALSIMDQAIASAPVENGRAVLQTDQIRELMGSVPNAVFERLMESVSAQQSAALMTDLDKLLTSGNSPMALSRQLVRYLRNCLMAKLGGENTALLEIAQDERARAARTAVLFTEEELTRNLQIALRTFDELNECQEQRFHLELGMLKLIHAQRLLPMEEILSGLASQSGAKRPAQRNHHRSPARTSSSAPPCAERTFNQPLRAADSRIHLSLCRQQSARGRGANHPAQPRRSFTIQSAIAHVAYRIGPRPADYRKTQFSIQFSIKFRIIGDVTGEDVELRGCISSPEHKPTGIKRL